MPTGSAGCASTSSSPIPAHLESVLNLIRHLDAVYDVYRILPGKKD